MLSVSGQMTQRSSVESAEIHSAHESQASSSVQSLSPAEEAEVRAITECLNDIFAAHKLPGNDSAAHAHNQQIDALIDSRARCLHDKEQTPAMIRDTFAKAQKLDRLATTASGALRAMPFAAASVLQYMKPAINKGDWLPTPLKPLTPFIAGAMSGVMDQVGTGVMNRATGNAHYLTAPTERLHDVMAASVKRNEPGLMKQAVDMGVAVQTYTARNAVRTVLAPALASHPTAQSAVDISVSALGGLAANAGFSNRMQSVQERDHLRGAAFVLGLKDKEPKADLKDETDWLHAYEAIQSASYSGAALNAGKRVAGLPIDIATDGFKAVRSLVSAPSLMQNGVALAGGFAGVGKLQELATKRVAQPAAKAAVSQLTNLAGSAGVFAAWTTAAVATGPAMEKAESFLQDTVKSAASSASSYVASHTAELATQTAGLATQGARRGGEAIVTTGAMLRSTYDSLRHRNVREPDIEEGGIPAGSPSEWPFRADHS